jgi:dolichol-phosphate mannosyltransferase
MTNVANLPKAISPSSADAPGAFGANAPGAFGANAPGASGTLSVALSVVIPAHNEAENLSGLLAEVRSALEGHIDYEVIVVDDASVDATEALLRELAARWPRLRPLRHRGRAGQSSAIVTGVRIARGQWIATLDGDGQNDPADIPRLWELLQTHAGGLSVKMIAGRRVRRQDSFITRLSSRIANAVRGWLLKDATPDTGCGLKLFDRTAFMEVPHFNHMHRFLPALFQSAGWATVSAPVGHRARRDGQSHYGVHNRLWIGILDLFGVMWLQRRKFAPQLAQSLAPNELAPNNSTPKE